MKREQAVNSVHSGLLAFLLAFGAAGCMVTGLDLDVPGLGRIAWACAIAAAAGALCFRFKWGGAALVSLLALVSWYVWRQEQPVQQLLSMLSHMARLYDSAYGWGVPQLLTASSGAGSMVYPVAVIGAVVALSVSWTVCRQKHSELALLAAGLPFASCFVVTDTVPEEPYLYIWLLGVLLLVLTNGTRRRSLSQGNELTAMAALPAALALGLLFLAVPKEGYDNYPAELQEKIVDWAQELPSVWEEVTENVLSEGDGTQESSEVNLRTVGPKAELTYPVMEVRAMGSGTLYLREQDYDTYAGTGWTAARHRMEQLEAPAADQDAGEVTIRTRSVRDAMILPYYPAETVTLTGGKLRNEEALKEYTLTQRVLSARWRQEVEAMGAVEQDYFAAERAMGGYQVTQRYLLLPNTTRIWAQKLVGEILSDERTTTAAADAIGRYVRNSAAYDLDTRWMPTEETDFARWFLEESDTGYCVHFATAAVVLLRAAGIQARYVEGYMTTAEYDSFVTVTADQAHAWAEYYEPLLDTWIVLEATPADLSDAEETAATEPEQEFTVPESTDAFVPTVPVQTQPQQQEESVNRIETDEAVRPLLPDWVGTVLKWALAMAILAAAGVGQRTLRLRLRAGRQHRGSPNARALQRWREILLLYRRLGEVPPEPLELLAQKAKYSQHTIEPEELEQLDAAIADAQARLKQRPWYQNLLDKYIFAAY